MRGLYLAISYRSGAGYADPKTSQGLHSTDLPKKRPEWRTAEASRVMWEVQELERRIDRSKRPVPVFDFTPYSAYNPEDELEFL